MRSGRLSTIVYIRDCNAGGQEVSGYVDYGHRWDTPGVTSARHGCDTHGMSVSMPMHTIPFGPAIPAEKCDRGSAF